MGAVDQLRKAVELRPSLVEAHRELARMARRSRDWATATSELEAVLAWEPRDVGTHDDLAEALKASGDGQGAARERAAARKLRATPKRQ
jgi:Flp pilus assembly protein TadD